MVSNEKESNEKIVVKSSIYQLDWRPADKIITIWKVGPQPGQGRHIESYKGTFSEFVELVREKDKDLELPRKKKKKRWYN